MYKKKEKPKHKESQTKSYRVNTEMKPLHKKEPHLITTRDQYLETEIYRQKTIVKCEDLESLLQQVKQTLENKLQILLVHEKSKEWADSMSLLSVNSFRTAIVRQEKLLDRYSQIIQGLQCLFSKLLNKQISKDKLYLKNEEDFLLFFKHLFGKPYTLCNFPHFRKILEMIWFTNILPDFTAPKIVENLELWAHGIQIPINPAAIQIQKLVFEAPHQIKKYVSFLRNDLIYCGINRADCLGLTPLLLAAHINSQKGYEYLIKAGAAIFLCPLLFSKSAIINTQQKKEKDKFFKQIVYPMQHRYQYNCLQILLVNKQYQMIADIFAYEETYKIKQMKKKRDKVLQKLKAIPDCCFQIDWKTFRGFLSFKELPKDRIFVRKKGGFLRIDYHVKQIDNAGPVGYYTLLLKCRQDKLQYFFIDHKEKKVINLMREVNYDKLKTRYDQFVHFGCVEDLKVSNIKINGKSKPAHHTQISCDFYFENVSKAGLYNFKKKADYEKQLINSQMLNYQNLQKSEIKATLKQSFIAERPKVKSKVIKSNNTFSIDWEQDNSLQLDHFLYVLELLDIKSILFIKIEKMLRTFKSQCAQYSSKYPKKIMMSGSLNGSDLSIEIGLKNFIYLGETEESDQFFETDYCVQQMGYFDQGQGLQSLQETIIMDESYTINVSQFLGKTEDMLDKSNEEANRRFEELLTQQIGQNSEEEEDYKNITGFRN